MGNECDIMLNTQSLMTTILPHVSCPSSLLCSVFGFELFIMANERPLVLTRDECVLLFHDPLMCKHLS